jgi:hypothetical protein
VGKRGVRLQAVAFIAGVAGAAPAGAAVVKTSFGVSATVVATCRILPGQAMPCARQVKPTTIDAEKPVVTVRRDPNTNLVTQTIEF